MAISTSSTSFLSLLVLFTLAGCGSDNGSATNTNSVSNEPISAEANGDIDLLFGSSSSNPSITNENPEETQLVAITFESGEAEDTGIFNRLKVIVDEDALNRNNAQEITIGLQGASFAEMKLPAICNSATTNNETTDELLRFVVCDLVTTTNEETNDQDVELTLPVYIIPYEINDFTVNVAMTRGAITPENSFQASFSYVPNGHTELTMEGEFAKEIRRILQIGKGSIVNSIHEGFRSLDNCPDGGFIEEISTSDFFFGTSQDRYVNCSHGAIVFDGEFISGFGRDSLFTELVDATMIISEPQLVDFSGTVMFTTERGRPDTTTLTGQIEQIDFLGEVIRFSQYSAYCEAGAPAQPHRVFIPGNEPDPIASVQTVFETNDNLLAGNRLNVNIEAKFKNQGKVALKSDNGSEINLVMAGGLFPTVYITLLGENSNENWIIPWEEEFAFECHQW